MLIMEPPANRDASILGPKQVGIALFGPYVIGVELASMLLLAGLVGAYHLGWRQGARKREVTSMHTHRARLCCWPAICSRWDWSDCSCGVI